MFTTRYMGSIEVPSKLEGNFQMEYVTDDRYGLDVHYRIRRNMPTPTRPVVPYTNVPRKHYVAVIMNAHSIGRAVSRQRGDILPKPAQEVAAAAEADRVQLANGVALNLRASACDSAKPSH